MINLRKRKIINLLINNPLTFEEIEQEIGVSIRTIRRDFILISHILENYGYWLDKKNNSYVIDDPHMNLKSILEKNDQVDFELFEKLLIYCSFLTNKEATINLKQLIDIVFISIDKIKQELELFLIENKIKYTIIKNNLKLDISDNQKFKLYNQIILRFFSAYSLEEIILQEEIKELGISKIKPYLLNYFDINQFNYVIKEVQIVFNKYNKYLSDQELFELVIKILIYLKHKYNFNFTDELIYVANDRIADDLTAIFKLTSKQDGNFILHAISNLITDLEFEKIDYKQIERTQRFISKIEDKLNLKFMKIKDLEYKIIMHDTRTKKQELQIISKDKIKFMDQLIIDNKIVYDVIEQINQELNLYSDSELLQIFIYILMSVEESIITRDYKILVVCSSGIATSQMIKKQIQMFLPNAEVDNIPLVKAIKFNHDNFDLIISNIATPNNFEDIIVNYSLQDSDFLNIKNLLLKRKQINYENKKKDQVNLNNFNYSNLDQEDGLKKHLLILKKENLIENDLYIYEKLKKREELGIGIPESDIAFYHTKSSSIKQIIIHTFITSKFEVLGLDLKNQKCKIILLMLIPESITSNYLEKINQLSYELISNKQLINEISTGKLSYLQEIIKVEEEK